MAAAEVLLPFLTKLFFKYWREREYIDNLKERSLIKHSMYISRFSIIRKVLKAGVYIFVTQTSNESTMPLESVSKNTLFSFNKSTINQQFQERRLKASFMFTLI